MKKLNPNWHWLVSLSILASMALSTRIGKTSYSMLADEPVALVMLHLKNESDLPALASLGLTVYSQLYIPEGGLYLLISADHATQDNLARLGYPTRILDADTQGAQYFLLYGLPEALSQAQSEVNLLVVEERQAIARLSLDQVIQLANLGIKALPLIPQPLAAPQTRPQAEALQSVAITPYSKVQAMISQVNSANLQTLVDNLSGEWPVTIDGSPYTIQTRYTDSDTPIKKATKYAYEHFQSLGLNSGYDYYPINGTQRRSVLAEQPGLTQFGRIVLLTAHIDDTSYINGNPLTYAPGADDNASGAAAVMLIANILRQYSFGCTLRYALFSGEEQGLYGSRAYAQDVYNRNENIIGVLNLDMLGYNTPGTGKTIELHTRPGNNKDLQIANLFRDVISAYNLNLTPQIVQDGLSFSDHQAFWEKGYAGILAIEDWDDHTPYYHQTTDRLSTLQMSYYTDYTRAAIGTFAHMGCLLDGQLSGVVSDAISAAPVPAAIVEARANGRQPETTTSQPDGAYQLYLSPDTYTVTVSASGYPAVTSTGIPIQAYQTTVKDFSLCQPVQAASFIFKPPYPKIDETITFTATTQGGVPPYSFTWGFGDGESGNGAVITHTYPTRGVFPVSLISDNLCFSPIIISTPVYVEAELIYLPLLLGNAQP